MTDDIYEIDTASVPRGDGIRDLTLTDRWNTPLGKPNGGYILAAMLRGLGEEMDADDPMVGAVTYLSSPETGPAELRTTSLRQRSPGPDRRGGPVGGRPAHRAAAGQLRGPQRWALDRARHSPGAAGPR